MEFTVRAPSEIYGCESFLLRMRSSFNGDTHSTRMGVGLALRVCSPSFVFPYGYCFRQCLIVRHAAKKEPISSLQESAHKLGILSETHL